MGVNRVGDSVLAQHLHGALVQDVRLGQIGGVRVALHEEVVNAGVGQKDRSREPATTTADDQYSHDCCDFRMASPTRPAARLAAVAPTPNNWSNTARGSRIIGNGCVGEPQLIVSV